VTEEVRKQIGYTSLFELNKEAKSPIIVNVGGAGSSKSYSIAQLFIYKLVNEQDKVFGVCRKTFPALRMTSMGLMLDLLKQYGLYREHAHNKTANNYTYGNNIIWWFSLDESEKIRSTNFSAIWVEEANELDWEMYITLKLRLRQPVKEGEVNQMFLSLNPSDSFNFIAQKLCGVKLGDSNSKPH